MKKLTEAQLKQLTRRQLWEHGFTMCSERDLCNERGGFRRKEIMIANIMKRQDAYEVVRAAFVAEWDPNWTKRRAQLLNNDVDDFVKNAVEHHVRARNAQRKNSY